MKKIYHTFKNINLRSKFLVCFLAVLIPLVGVLTAAAYTNASSILAAKSEEQTIETVQQFSNTLDNYMNLMLNHMEVVADSPVVQEELNAPADEVNIAGDSFFNRSRQIHRTMLQQFSSITMHEMEVIGNNGANYYISVEYAGRNPEIESSLLAAADEAKGRTVFVGSDGNGMQLVKLVKDLQTYRPIGYTRIRLKKDYLDKLTKNINFGSGGQIIVFDSGTAADPNAAGNSGTAADQSAADQSAADQSAADQSAADPDTIGHSSVSAANYIVAGDPLSASQLDFSRMTGSSGHFSTEMGTAPYNIIYVRSSTTSWTTVAVIPSAYLKKDLAPLRRTIFIIAAIALLICLLAARAIARTFTAPIAQTADAFALLATGDFDVRLPEDRADEIGTMNRVFNDTVTKIPALMQKVVQAEVLEKEMEFKTLQSQMNPHFLYNTLDVINWIAWKNDEQEICNLVTAISNLMRISISDRHTIISLKQELDYVKDYLYIQHVRYKDRFEEVYEIDEALLMQAIPKLIVQPIVENAIVHGIENTASKNRLFIKATRDGADVTITVRDTGVGMPPEKVAALLQKPAADEKHASGLVHTNLGMYAVHQRIKFLYGEEYGLTIESKEGEGTAVSIHIPYQEDSSQLYRIYSEITGERYDSQGNGH